MPDVADICFVGGGYRTVSFLANQPWLLERRTRILEKSAGIGGGAFADFDCVSTSVSSRFVSQIAPCIADQIRDQTLLRRLGQPAAQPVALTEIARTMTQVGEVLAGLLPPGSVRCGTEVSRIDVHDIDPHMTVHAAGGLTYRSRHVVIACGREERLHPELRPWVDKVVLSSHALSVARTPALLARLSNVEEPVVIAGGSHSGVAALMRLLRLRVECGRPDLPIVVLRRSPVRLHYSSLTQARAERRVDAEAEVDPVKDVCPVTGQVHRDSGLRGAGRALYLQLLAGEIDHVRVEQRSSVAAAGDLLSPAGLIVQALGYHGRAPEIVLADGKVRRNDSDERLYHRDDGTAIIAGREIPQLSVLRVEPTPPDVRDHGLFGQNLYRDLGGRLFDCLAASS